MSPTVLAMKEWQERLPDKDSPLFQRFFAREHSRAAAQTLRERGIVEIEELRQGLRVVTNSHVGSIWIDDWQLIVRPKIESLPLFTLLRYAYGLRDLKIFGRATHDPDFNSFQDILIFLFCAEAEEIIFKGLHRRYVARREDLSVVRGTIDLRRLAVSSASLRGQLPCVFFSRQENNQLNQVLLSGLDLAFVLTGDGGLKSRLHRLRLALRQQVESIELNTGLLVKMEKSLNRLNEHYRSALKLTSLLLEAMGTAFDNEPVFLQAAGFFFNMNTFFQSLVSKLLKQYLPDYTIRDEYTLHESYAYTPGFNPLARPAPRLRPDFAVLKGGRIQILLDAKYRDLWETSLPSNWLYQLTVYAASGPPKGVVKILYPTVYANAKMQSIDVREPGAGRTAARVVLQPIHLSIVADWLESREKRQKEIQEYVRELVFKMPGANKSVPLGPFQGTSCFGKILEDVLC